MRLSNFNRKIVSVSAAAVLICSAASSIVSGQDSLRNSVYGNQKKSAAANRDSQNQKKKTAPAKKARSTVRNYAPTTPKKFEATRLVPVTFTAKEPGVEIWLNSKNIGLTDNKSQFTKRLAPGKYRLMAKNKRQVFLLTKEINVTAEQKSFNLFTEQPAKPIAVTDLEKPKIEEKSEMEVALEISNKVKSILENFANPATTDTVTPEDWQTVFYAAQYNQLQGYTAVQIEAQRWFASGQIELANREYQNALTAFTKAQEFMPTSALPFYGLGNTYFENKQYAESIKFYQKALQIDPQLAMAYKRLADAQRLLKNEKEAIAAYKTAIRLGYRTPETRYWLGSLLLDGKQTEEGLKMLEEVAVEMPRAEVFIHIASGYEKLKRDVSAIEYYQKAIEADRSSAVAYYRLANVYAEQREHTKAKDAFEKAIELDPDGKYLNRSEAQKKLREVSAKINK